MSWRDYNTGSMIRMRAFFFVFIGGGGFLIPFLNLYYSRAGMSGAQIGLLSMLAALSALLAAPVWGQWSDRSRQVGRLLLASLLAAAAAALVLGAQRSFPGFALATSLHSLLSAGSIPLSTTLAMLAIAAAGRGGFGEIRRWGSLGWAVFVLAAGPLLETWGLGLIFPAYALAFVISALLLPRTPARPPSVGEVGMEVNRPTQAPAQEIHKTSHTDGAPLPAFTPPRPSLLSINLKLPSTVRLLFFNPALRVLFAALLISGVLNAGWRQFWQIYMDQLGATESLIAVGAMLGAAVEMPAMLYVDRWNRRFGPRRVLLASLGLDAARLSIVLLAPRPLTILLVNAVGGVAFSLVTIGLVAYVLEHTPEYHKTTMLAVFTVTLANLILIVGGPLTGAAFDALGAYWLYALGAAGSFLGWAVLYWGTRTQNGLPAAR